MAENNENSEIIEQRDKFSVDIPLKGFSDGTMQQIRYTDNEHQTSPEITKINKWVLKEHERIKKLYPDNEEARLEEMRKIKDEAQKRKAAEKSKILTYYGNVKGENGVTPVPFVKFYHGPEGPYLKFTQEFLDSDAYNQFKAQGVSDSLLSIAFDQTEDGKLVPKDIKLKSLELDHNGDIRVKFLNEQQDFGAILSAFGMQASIKGAQGIYKNTFAPNNFDIDSRIIELASTNKGTYKLGRGMNFKSVAYQNLLLSYTMHQRDLINGPESAEERAIRSRSGHIIADPKPKTFKKDFGDLSLYSVPYVQKTAGGEKTTEYFNAAIKRDANGKNENFVFLNLEYRLTEKERTKQYTGRYYQIEDVELLEGIKNASGKTIESPTLHLKVVDPLVPMRHITVEIPVENPKSLAKNFGDILSQYSHPERTPEQETEYRKAIRSNPDYVWAKVYQTEAELNAIRMRRKQMFQPDDTVTKQDPNNDGPDNKGPNGPTGTEVGGGINGGQGIVSPPPIVGGDDKGKGGDDKGKDGDDKGKGGDGLVPPPPGGNGGDKGDKGKEGDDKGKEGDEKGGKGGQNLTPPPINGGGGGTTPPTPVVPGDGQGLTPPNSGAPTTPGNPNGTKDKDEEDKKAKKEKAKKKIKFAGAWAAWLILAILAALVSLVIPFSAALFTIPLVISAMPAIAADEPFNREKHPKKTKEEKAKEKADKKEKRKERRLQKQKEREARREAKRAHKAQLITQKTLAKDKSQLEQFNLFENKDPYKDAKASGKFDADLVATGKRIADISERRARMQAGENSLREPLSAKEREEYKQELIGVRSQLKSDKEYLADVTKIAKETDAKQKEAWKNYTATKQLLQYEEKVAAGYKPTEEEKAKMDKLKSYYDKEAQKRNQTLQEYSSSQLNRSVLFGERNGQAEEIRQSMEEKVRTGEAHAAALRGAIVESDRVSKQIQSEIDEQSSIAASSNKQLEKHAIKAAYAGAKAEEAGKRVRELSADVAKKKHNLEIQQAVLQDNLEHAEQTTSQAEAGTDIAQKATPAFKQDVENAQTASTLAPVTSALREKEEAEHELEKAKAALEKHTRTSEKEKLLAEKAEAEKAIALAKLQTLYQEVPEQEIEEEKQKGSVNGAKGGQGEQNRTTDDNGAKGGQGEQDKDTSTKPKPGTPKTDAGNDTKNSDRTM